MLPKSASDIARRARNRGRVAAWTIRAALLGRRARREDAASVGAMADDSPFPAFDPRGFNPIGRRRDSDGETASLAPGRRALRRLRRAHVVSDSADFHADAVSRAALLSRLAAMGVVVHAADAEPRLKTLLGDDLFDIIDADPVGMDAFSREIRAMRSSRAAMRRHSSWARERMRGDADFPLVSILLATNRPGFLAWALDAAARQTYPRAELVLAMHGDGFGDAERGLARFPHPVKTLRIPSSATLGAALAAAARAAGGSLLTKMDDDDFYAPDHIWDLVLAQVYSGADLVGKTQEFVYLADADKTAYLRQRGGERYWTHALAGGTMLITRRALARAGGWRDVPSGVDAALLEDALRSGARVYRVSGIGYVYARRGVGHTWNDAKSAPAAILAQADRVWDGLRLDRAAVPPPAYPPRLIAPDR